MNAAVGLMDGLSLDGDRCIRVIPRHLPHQDCIRSRIASVNCEPGFLSEVIELLGKQSRTEKCLSDAVLIIDAIAICKGTWWDAKKKTYVGHVDYGTALIEAEED